MNIQYKINTKKAESNTGSVFFLASFLYLGTNLVLSRILGKVGERVVGHGIGGEKVRDKESYVGINTFKFK